MIPPSMRARPYSCVPVFALRRESGRAPALIYLRGQSSLEAGRAAISAKKLLTALLSLALTLTFAPALANDFPTIERVLFVEACVRDHPDRPHQEMVYKCSCAVDAIASDLPYDEHVELATSFDAGQIAGERGAAVRESTEGKSMSKRFKEARAKALASCMIQ